MKYDLFAEFYENSSEKPRYVVWMGSIYPKTVNELESMGFQESLSDGYLDYVKKNVSEKDLEKLTQPGFECEMMDVIDELAMIDDPDEVYNERVKIIARELEVIDDEGNYADMSVMVGDTVVSFFNSSAMYPVVFQRLWNENNEIVDRFRIPVVKLKRHFKVLTLTEVKEKLQAMNEEKEWSYDKLKELFYKQEGKSRMIDKMIERKDRSYPIVISPHEILDYDYKDQADCLYAYSMYFLIDGHIDEGKRKLEESFKMGNQRAGQALEYGYGAGWFGKRDYEEQIKIIRKLIRKKNGEAMNDLAIAYSYGLGVKKSNRWYVYWLKQAMEHKCLAAFENLALYYIFEEKGRPNLRQGIEYAKFAVYRGGEQAMNTLGLCYEEGVGVEKDGKKAFELFSQAVKNGASGFAEHHLARCYRKGIGTEIDLEKAEAFEKLAIEHGVKPKK